MSKAHIHPETERVLEMAINCSDEYLAGKLTEMGRLNTQLRHTDAAIIIAAGLRLAADTFPSRRALEARPISKGELAKRLYPDTEGYTVDCALPQGWIDRVQRTLNAIGLETLAPEGVASHFVTVYSDEPGESREAVKPITRQGIDILAALAMLS